MSLPTLSSHSLDAIIRAVVNATDIYGNPLDEFRVGEILSDEFLQQLPALSCWGITQEAVH